MSSTVKFALLVALAVVSALVLRALFIAAQAQPAEVSPTHQRVRVAAADLPPGLLLRDSDLAWKELPRGQMPSQAVRQGDATTPDVVGAAMLQAVAGGMPVTSKDVVFPNAPGFLAAALKPDMRAISVAIDDVSGNAGLIQPGDYVDLILTQNLAGKTESPRLSVSSETVVNHARVLAVGSEFTRPKGDNTQGSANARTVTLEVTPRTAEVVAISARLGTLSLALRSFATLVRNPSDEHTASETAEVAPPVWAGDVSRAVRALPTERDANGLAARANAAPAVLVYRGSNKGDAETTAVATPVQTAAVPQSVPPVRLDTPPGEGMPPVAQRSAHTAGDTQ